MNKICAAGTGSFVEEQAARMGIPLEEFGPLALTAQAPVELGERCTVFIETAIQSALAQGASQAEVAAGLCQSIVRNYLHKVVGSKLVGRRIVLQGGVAYNPGIVAAFRQEFGAPAHRLPLFFHQRGFRRRPAGPGDSGGSIPFPRLHRPGRGIPRPFSRGPAQHRLLPAGAAAASGGVRSRAGPQAQDGGGTLCPDDPQVLPLGQRLLPAFGQQRAPLPTHQ